MGPEAALTPEIEIPVKPIAVPPGNKAPKPVHWYVSAEKAAISPSGKYVVIGYKGGQSFNVGFRVWNLETGKLFAALRGHEDVEDFLPAFCSFLADDQSVLSISQQGKAIIHRLAVNGKSTMAKPVNTFWVHDLGLQGCALSENGRYLITLGMDAGVEHFVAKIWDLEKAKLVRILDDEIYSDWSVDVAISAGGDFAFTRGIRSRNAGGDTAISDIHLWDVRQNKLLKRFPGRDDWVAPMAFSKDGKEFVLGHKHDREREFEVWDLNGLRKTKTVPKGSKLPQPGPGEYSEGNDLYQAGQGNSWYGSWRCNHETDPPPAVAFWDFGSTKDPKVIRLDSKRFHKSQILPKAAPTRFYLGARAISIGGKIALVATGDNGCSQEFRRSDESDRSGGFLVSRQVGVSLMIHVWDLTTGDLRWTWTDPTPSVDGVPFLAK
jgi:WD40 repeat protein